MHGLSLFKVFTCITFVLELLPIATQFTIHSKVSNIAIRFQTSTKVFAKSATLSTYNKPNNYIPNDTFFNFLLYKLVDHLFLFINP